MILAEHMLGIKILLMKEQNLIALFYLQSRWIRKKVGREKRNEGKLKRADVLRNPFTSRKKCCQICF